MTKIFLKSPKFPQVKLLTNKVDLIIIFPRIVTSTHDKTYYHLFNCLFEKAFNDSDRADVDFQSATKKGSLSSIMFFEPI